MSDNQQTSGASNDNGGAESNNNQSQNSRVISQEDHKRALDDLMKFKTKYKEVESKLSAYEKAAKELEEKKLAESGEYQKLIQLKEQKISELETQLTGLSDNLSGMKKSLTDAAKLNAVRDRLPGTVKNPAYLGFIDIEQVALNPETNEIDLDSVDKVVDNFVRSYPELIASDPKRLPGGMASAASKLTWEQWNALPLKDKKSRIKDVEGFKPSAKK